MEVINQSPTSIAVGVRHSGTLLFRDSPCGMNYGEGERKKKKRGMGSWHQTKGKMTRRDRLTCRETDGVFEEVGPVSFGPQVRSPYSIVTLHVILPP